MEEAALFHFGKWIDYMASPTAGMKTLPWKGRGLGHAPFGKIFLPLAGSLGLAVVDPLAKFKECSFIHSRNIEGGLKVVKGLRYMT